MRANVFTAEIGCESEIGCEIGSQPKSAVNMPLLFIHHSMVVAE